MANNKNIKISVSGLRGIVEETPFPEIVIKVSKAFGLMCNKGSVVLGRDTRSSGEMLQRLISHTLRVTGCQVIDIGIATTPTVEIMVPELRASGGIIITASHNPPEWNGIKLLNSEGLFIDQSTLDHILAKTEGPEFEKTVDVELQQPEIFNRSVEVHLEKVLSLEYLPLNLIRECKFKVGYDGNGGTGCVVFQDLFHELGCQTVFSGCDILGEFQHGLEPTADNLKQVALEWQAKGIDIGFASDPDADRLVVINGKGEVLSEEYTLALAALFVLSKKKGSIVVNLSTSNLNQEIANQFGVNLHRTAIGERNVISGMIERNAVIGGEGNGGVILPDVHLGRDGVVGAALILALLAERNQTLMEIINGLPRYYMIKEKISDNGKLDSNPEAFVQELSPVKVDYTDGIWLEFEEGWLHLRKSNTEPIIRLIAETNRSYTTKNLIKKAMDYLLE